MNMQPLYQPQQWSMTRMNDKEFANVVLSQLKRMAEEYTRAVLTAVNPQVRKLLEQMLERTIRHHEELLQLMADRQMTESQEAARQEDVQQRIFLQQQRGNEIHAFVHQHLQYGGYGEANFRSSVPSSGVPISETPNQTNPSHPMSQVNQNYFNDPVNHTNPMNQVYAHQPGTFGFNQEFGYNAQKIHEQQANQYQTNHQQTNQYQTNLQQSNQHQTNRLMANQWQMNQYQHQHQRPTDLNPSYQQQMHREPPVPDKKASNQEQQIEALSTPGIGVYQSAVHETTSPATGADVASNHTGGDQEALRNKKSTINKKSN